MADKNSRAQSRLEKAAREGGNTWVVMRRKPKLCVKRLLG